MSEEELGKNNRQRFRVDMSEVDFKMLLYQFQNGLNFLSV
jgi:hypothetical protein